jgi:hypothetical protein
LKPEGHQFTKLRELLLQRLSPGVQEHILTAFWNYLLLTELAQKVIIADGDIVKRRGDRVALYDEIKNLIDWDPQTEQGDFSERLLDLVDRIIKRSEGIAEISLTSQITRLIYSNWSGPLF